MNMLTEEVSVVNLGLPSFAENITAAGGAVCTVDWRPPAGGDSAAAWRLAQLQGDKRVAAANEEAFGRYLRAQPRLVDAGLAAEAIPELAANRLILHAGPPIDYAEMCGPMQGAIIGAILYEGWAEGIAAAAALAASGGVQFAPCHHYGAVGPMAGVISPSSPVWVVENVTDGNRALSNFNEGLGQVLRFGANGPEVLQRLHWMREELLPSMRAAVRRIGGIDLLPIMAQALLMGDEVHNRNTAATGLLFKQLVPALHACDLNPSVMHRAVEFIAENDHFFLNVSMAASKAMLDPAARIPGSSMVTAMARNGVNFGIRLSGTGDRWFQAAANPVDGLFLPGYGVTDAAADLGDSAITETAGVGGFAMAAAPAIVQFVGGTPADAIAHSRRMRSITLGSNPVFGLPALDFAGSAAGIDALAVVDTGTLPIINSGIAHKEAGVGQIGAGITCAPLGCFIEALDALADQLGIPAGTPSPDIGRSSP